MEENKNIDNYEPSPLVPMTPSEEPASDEALQTPNKKQWWIIGSVVLIVVFASFLLNRNDDVREIIRNCQEDCKTELFLIDSIEELRIKASDTSLGNTGISSKQIYDSIKKSTDDSLKIKIRVDEPDTPAEAKALSDLFFSYVTKTAFVYLVSGEEKYLDRATKLMSTVSGWQSWNHIYENNNGLDRDAITIGMSVAYNWLYDSLTVKERELFAKSIINKGIIPIHKATKSNSFPFTRPANSNHFSAGMTALGIASTALINEYSEVAPALDVAIMGVKDYLRLSGGIDGGYPESISYGAFGFHHLDIFQQIISDDIYRANKEYVEKFNEFIIYSTFPDNSQIVLFNDQSATAMGAIQLARCTRYFNGQTIAKRCQQQIKELIAAEYKLPKTPFLFLSYDPHKPIMSNADLDNSKWFRDIGHFMYRESWSNKDSLFIALKAETHNPDEFPTNYAHSHGDGGQFVIFKGGKEYVTDVGYQVGSKFAVATYDAELNIFSRGSYGHNNLVFNNQYQTKLESKITDVVTKDNTFYVKMDLADSYPDEAQLKRYTREFIFIEDTLFIIDSFDGPKEFTNRFQVIKRTGESSFVTNKVLMKNDKFNIEPHGGGSLLYGKILYPEVEMELVEQPFKGPKGSDTARFIEQRGTNSNYLINVLSFSDDDYELTEYSDSFQIKGKYSFCYEKQAGACSGEKFGGIHLSE